ncbi:multicopper oxidase family protein [Trinickia violacea]|uniref:Multicopper oxidase family protein n=1 Tax=Trinickia violacea TaxID=2571746 RepID=A0A4P8IIF8_9BURK|nr:multicopper oxidase family protein [Trinickia violacea]QCP48488.1 multicopper oxidase family protein [Trinickia violacea]
MIRREFLVRTLGAAAASLFARDVFAQQHAHGMMEMPNMPAMPSMPAGKMPMMSAALAPADALPAGASLPALRTLVNQSGERGVFRATLVAKPHSLELLPGTTTSFWLYGDDPSAVSGSPINGPVVGPLIDVREGDTVEIAFVNGLLQPSTIHWHGMPVPPDQDGNPMNPVAPGATHVYRFTLPRGSAGTYWYHPHPHMVTAEQVYRGLAGPIIVRAADDPLAEWPERHLFISDLKLAADGTVAPNDMMDWMNGREGQFVLVNGVRRPRIVVSRDERWRVWNASSARYVRLTFDDGRRFAQVGTDGGLLESPREDLTELLLVPGERAELIVRAGSGEGAEGARTAPSRAVLTAAVYDRSKMAMTHGSLPPDPSRALADVEFTPAADANDVEASSANIQAQRLLPTHLRTITSLGKPTARKSVVFSEQMDMAAMHRPGASNHGMPAGMSFLINGATYDPNRTTLTSRRGEVELWSIENRTDMDHPFHLHGTQFQIVERESDGKTIPEPFRAWRDMANVKPGETVRIATMQSMRGERMFHCHILEHEDLGMMGTLKVI